MVSFNFPWGRVKRPAHRTNVDRSAPNCLNLQRADRFSVVFLCLSKVLICNSRPKLWANIPEIKKI